MSKHTTYLQLGRWRVSIGFCIMATLALSWLAHDLHQMATNAPFSDTLPSVPKAYKGSYHDYGVEGGGIAHFIALAGKSAETEQPRYWGPDGTPIVGVPYSRRDLALTMVTNPQESTKVDGMKRYNFCFELERVPQQPLDIRLESKFGEGYYEEWKSNSAAYYSDQFYDASAQGMMNFPSQETRGTFSMGIAFPDKTVAFAEMPLPGRPGIRRGAAFKIEELKRSEDVIGGFDLTIPVVSLPEDREGRPLYFYKVYAVDWLGELHPTAGDTLTMGRKGKAICYWSYLSLGDIRAIRLVASPYHWFTFENQPLKPH